MRKQRRISILAVGAGQHIFNRSTKGLNAGTHRLFINLGDGVTRTVNLDLK